ncbi:MAG: DUF455 family protein [Bdellovibrionaceae bacterium]|nr:DUF455 family protein [Bdellovibrio sp.]
MWAFEIENIFEKLKTIRHCGNEVFNLKHKVHVPDLPARDALVLEFKAHPVKKGFSSLEGQARMLHDLASIELQAMELGLRTLVEFPEAPEAFRHQLWAVTLSESEHLEMCLTEIENLGFKWGDWPINCGLWQTVSQNDSLLDRVLIVHRYLEGSGLDAGDTLIRRLAGVNAGAVRNAVQIINDEEIGHVLFGSKWFEKLCLAQNLDPVDDFESRMNRLRVILPKRVAPVNQALRLKAGFTIKEISYLEKLRESFLEKESVWLK